jgi:hypothetical protein
MEDRSFLRLGAVAAVVGAVVALVGNLLHPRYGDIPDSELYRNIADSDTWRIADAILVVALVLTIAGTVAIARSLEGGHDGGLARYGSMAAVLGGAIAIAQIGIETFAFKQAAVVVQHAQPQDIVGAFWATNAIDKLNTSLFDTWTIVYLGLAPLLLGTVALRTRRYPVGVGALALAGGLVCLAVGFVNLLRQDQTATQIPFLVGSLLVTAWILVAGALLWRRGEIRSDAQLAGQT